MFKQSQTLSRILDAVKVGLPTICCALFFWLLFVTQATAQGEPGELYGGIEIEDRGLVEHRQALLATPTEERGLEILRSMIAR